MHKNLKSSLKAIEDLVDSKDKQTSKLIMIRALKRRDLCDRFSYPIFCRNFVKCSFEIALTNISILLQLVFEVKPYAK